MCAISQAGGIGGVEKFGLIAQANCAGVCVVGQRQADVQGVELDRVAVAVEVLL